MTPTISACLAALIVIAGGHAAIGVASSDLSIGAVRVVEGDSGERVVEVIVTLSSPASGPVTASYATTNGTAVAGSDYHAASGSVTFALGDVVKRITLGVIGDGLVEGDETFDVALSNASGATIAGNAARVTIVDDDFRERGPSVYEVRLTYVGSTGSMAGAEGCPVRQNGRVMLTGLIAGSDDVRPDDDINYRGVLQMEADIDLCEATGPDGATRLCAIRAIGAGVMNTELTVYADNRGGYVKVSKAPGAFLTSISGSCDAALIDEERSAFPNDSMAVMFNGQELPLSQSGPLQVGRYADGGVLVEVLRVVHRNRP